MEASLQNYDSLREEKTMEEKKDGADTPLELFKDKPSEEKQYFDRSKEVLGPKGNGLAAKLLKSKKRVLALSLGRLWK